MEEDYKYLHESQRREDWERYGPYGPPRHIRNVRMIPFILSGLFIVGIIAYLAIEGGLYYGVLVFSAFAFIFYGIPVLVGYLSSADHKGFGLFTGLFLPLLTAVLFFTMVIFV